MEALPYDVFISHASEDKTDIAEPLAKSLEQLGYKVWLDKQELRLGDQLRRKINQGLSQSRYGVVILSKAFFTKSWPMEELDALMGREEIETTIVLPIRHGLSQDQVKAYHPTVANKLSASTDGGLQNIVGQIAAVLGSPLSGHVPNFLTLAVPDLERTVVASDTPAEVTRAWSGLSRLPVRWLVVLLIPLGFSMLLVQITLITLLPDIFYSNGEEVAAGIARDTQTSCVPTTAAPTTPDKIDPYVGMYFLFGHDKTIEWIHQNPAGGYFFENEGPSTVPGTIDANGAVVVKGWPVSGRIGREEDGCVFIYWKENSTLWSSKVLKTKDVQAALIGDWFNGIGMPRIGRKGAGLFVVNMDTKEQSDLLNKSDLPLSWYAPGWSRRAAIPSPDVKKIFWGNGQIWTRI